MKKSVSRLCLLLIVIGQATPCIAQTEFKKALQKKHNLKSVTCFACHAKKSEVPQDQQAAYKKKAKSFRNDFGKEFDKHLKNKNVTKRLAEVKRLKSTDPKKKKVVDEVTKEFLDALQKVDPLKERNDRAAAKPRRHSA